MVYGAEGAYEELNDGKANFVKWNLRYRKGLHNIAFYWLGSRATKLGIVNLEGNVPCIHQLSSVVFLDLKDPSSFNSSIFSGCVYGEKIASAPSAAGFLFGFFEPQMFEK
jgi:hypothetical protein